MSEITVGHQVLSTIGDRLREAGIRGRVHIVSDDVVFPLYGGDLIEGLSAGGYEADVRVLPAGEKTKSLEQASVLYDWLIERRAERGEAIVALGGGVIGDLAGFVAATYLRGVPLVQVPTTLLAQIDSAIGGKVAVNHTLGKNLVGAFYPARLVFADVAMLRSLSRRELVSGWAEVIKTAMILDGDMLAQLEDNAEALITLDPEISTEVVRRSINHKVRVVSEDEREQGLRIILNYGHTIGHALESATNYVGMLHGEAVAIGMVGAAAISQRIGWLSSPVAERQKRCLSRFGLPTHVVDLLATPPSVDAVLGAIGFDKKVERRAVRWVLLEDIARVKVNPNVPADLVRDVVASLVEG